MMMYLFTTVPHPHGHWQLQELLGNQGRCDPVNLLNYNRTNNYRGYLTDVLANFVQKSSTACDRLVIHISECHVVYVC